jgi:hypothetical protein
MSAEGGGEGEKIERKKNSNAIHALKFKALI